MGYEEIRSFQIDRAQCYDERDRTVVKGNIATFMRDLRLADYYDSVDDALLVFDLLVREEVPHAVRASFGSTGIRYRYAVVIFMSQASLANAFLHLVTHLAVLPLTL